MRQNTKDNLEERVEILTYYNKPFTYNLECKWAFKILPTLQIQLEMEEQCKSKDQ